MARPAFQIQLKEVFVARAHKHTRTGESQNREAPKCMVALGAFFYTATNEAQSKNIVPHRDMGKLASFLVPKPE